MQLNLSLQTWIHWLHGTAVLVWVGLWLYPLLGLSSQPRVFLSSLRRIQPVLLSVLAIALVTGGINIVLAGGFGVLPRPFHIKITLALVMAILTLVAIFYQLPKAEKQIETLPNGQEKDAIKGISATAWGVVGSALLILLILAGLGLL